MASNDQPELSVVVVAICGASHVARCLRALEQQAGDGPDEIIVAYDPRLEGIPELRERCPGIRVCTRPDMYTPEELASAGMIQATGRIIGLLEDHCIPDANWCAAVLKAHEMPVAAVGGAVEIPSDNLLDWAFSYSDYYRYLSPVPEGVVRHLSVCNVSYKRSHLEPIAAVWADDFHEEAVHPALLSRGSTLWLTPRLVVRQDRRLVLRPSLHERYSFGRLFGSRRVVEIGPLRRLVYFLSAPVIPLLLLSRMIGVTWRRGRSFRLLVRGLPMLAMFTLVWCWGEFLGNVIGRPPRNVFTARPSPVAES